MLYQEDIVLYFYVSDERQTFLIVVSLLINHNFDSGDSAADHLS